MLLSFRWVAPRKVSGARSPLVDFGPPIRARSQRRATTLLGTHGQRIRVGVVAPDGAGPRVDVAERGFRRLWSGRVEREARGDSTPVGQDGRSNGPPEDPVSSPPI